MENYPNECLSCGAPTHGMSYCFKCLVNLECDKTLKTSEEMLEKLNQEIEKALFQTAPKNNVSEDKAQINLIPLDLIIPMLEPTYREGIIKYKQESWRLGFNCSVMYAALMRHLTKWFFELESLDPEAKEKYNINKSHLGAAIFCLINLYNTEHNFPDLDDRPLKLVEKLKHGNE